MKSAPLAVPAVSVCILPHKGNFISADKKPFDSTPSALILLNLFWVVCISGNCP
jgi:hypothetical protein